MDQVIASSHGGHAHVFRLDNYSKRWKCIAKSNKTSKVRFIRRRGNYWFKVTPEDGETKVSMVLVIVSPPCGLRGGTCTFTAHQTCWLPVVPQCINRLNDHLHRARTSRGRYVRISPSFCRSSSFSACCPRTIQSSRVVTASFKFLTQAI